MEISAIDTMWVLFGTMFIFFMHSGFALLETGFSELKIQAQLGLITC